MAPVTTEAIAVHDLSKSYATRGGAVVALDRTTFDVAECEFVSVVGPSGCGKSTLLKILAGILPASSGDARLRGTLIDGPRRDIVLKWHVIKDKVAGKDLVTNELIDEINKFDPAKVAAEAKAWKP